MGHETQKFGNIEEKLFLEVEGIKKASEQEWFGMVWYDLVWYGLVWFGWYSLVWGYDQ